MRNRLRYGMVGGGKRSFYRSGAPKSDCIGRDSGADGRLLQFAGRSQQRDRQVLRRGRRPIYSSYAEMAQKEAAKKTVSILSAL